MTRKILKIVECKSEYHAMAAQIADIVVEKQEAYGDSFGKSGEIMKILYPDGISHDKMDDALMVVRIIDKLFRLANEKDSFGESPCRDMAGYALLGAVNSENGR